MKPEPELKMSILMDEIGLQTGRVGPFHVKTSYQLLFRREGRNVAPFAVEGLATPFREGVQESVPALFEICGEADRNRLEKLCQALHLRNFLHLDAPWLVLFVNFAPVVSDCWEETALRLSHLAGEWARSDVKPRALVCEITETVAMDRSMLAALAGRMRTLRFRVAVDDYGAGQSTLDRIGLIQPDIVKLDGRWFRKLAQVQGGTRLLAAMIAGFHELGAQVLAEGIETPAELAAAIDAGADYFQGYLLHRPGLAGSIFDLAPKSLRALLEPPCNVVPISGRHTDAAQRS